MPQCDRQGITKYSDINVLSAKDITWSVTGLQEPEKPRAAFVRPPARPLQPETRPGREGQVA